MIPKYEILFSRAKMRNSDEQPKDYQSDLEKKHINLQVNRKFWAETKGNGDLRCQEYRLPYIYEITKAFSAGSSRFLEYQFQYSGSVVFNHVVFDVIGDELIYRIDETPKFGKDKRFRLHVPFDTDIDPRKLRIVIIGINKS